MKRNEQDQLLEELISGEELSELRQTSLELGLRSIRRQRRRRRVARICILAMLPLLLAIGVLLRRWPGNAEGPITASNPLPPTASAPTVEAHEVKFITDEELFALFPDRPMALVGKPGRQQLVFLDRTISNPIRRQDSERN